MAKAAKKRTITAQRKHTTEQHPQVKLVPDKAAEQHPKVSQTTCGATRSAGQLELVCELPLLHAGDHAGQGYGWRRRSGDDD